MIVLKVEEKKLKEVFKQIIKKGVYQSTTETTSRIKKPESNQK